MGIGKVSADKNQKEKTNSTLYLTTPLHEAIRCFSGNTARMLISYNKRMRNIGQMKIDILVLLNHEWHYPLHSIIRYRREPFLKIFEEWLENFMPDIRSPGLYTQDKQNLIHIAAKNNAISYFQDFAFKHELDMQTKNNNNLVTPMELAVLNCNVAIAKIYNPDKIIDFLETELYDCLEFLIACPEFVTPSIILRLITDILQTKKIDNRILTVLAENFAKIEEKMSLIVDYKERFIHQISNINNWKSSLSEDSKSKILSLYQDLARDKNMLPVLSSYCGELFEQDLKILTSISQFYNVVSILLNSDNYQGRDKLERILLAEKSLNILFEQLSSAIEAREDEMIISCLRYFTAISKTSSALLIQEESFINEIIGLLTYQQCEQVVIATCHLVYAITTGNRNNQDIMSRKYCLQGALKPVLRAFRPEVKVAAVRATWALAVNQTKKVQRRVAARFGLREINQMLVSTPQESIKKSEVIERENLKFINQTQAFGLTILRAFCHKWPSGQLLGAEKETLILIKSLCMRYLDPERSSISYRILLMKTIIDLLSIDGTFMVNSVVKESMIRHEIGFDVFLCDIWLQHREKYSLELNFTFVKVLNFLQNKENVELGSVLDGCINWLLCNEGYEQILCLAHTSIERSQSINISWLNDILPKIREYQNSRNYNKLSEVIVFTIFCSASFQDIESTACLAYVFSSLLEIIRLDNFTAKKYAMKVVLTLPLIGVNFLTALAEYGIITELMDTLESLQFYDSGQLGLDKEELINLTVSAIATLTIDATGRRLVLSILRKKYTLIPIIREIIAVDKDFWADVGDGENQTNLDFSVYAVPEVCLTIDKDFPTNLKFLQQRSNSFNNLNAKRPGLNRFQTSIRNDRLPRVRRAATVFK